MLILIFLILTVLAAVANHNAKPERDLNWVDAYFRNEARLGNHQEIIETKGYLDSQPTFERSKIHQIPKKTIIINGYLYFANSRKAVHRWVIEKHIDRKLSKEEVVHHEDGNKLNNSLENLRLFRSQWEHDRYHRKLLAETGNWYGKTM